MSDDQSESQKFKFSSSWSALQCCAALCSQAEFKPGQEHVPILKKEVIGDASEAALLKCVEMTTGDIKKYRNSYSKIAEIQFNSTNKYHASIHESESRTHNILVMKGAPEKMIERCSTILIDGKEHPISEKWTEHFHTVCNNL